MGPGPSDVHPRVLGAMAKATIGHLDPEFIALMEDIKDLLRYTFRTENKLTLPHRIQSNSILHQNGKSPIHTIILGHQR